MKFLDESKIYLKDGEDGNGCVSFSHEKFIEFGGPNGGAVGNGGSIYFVASRNSNTLIDYLRQKKTEMDKDKIKDVTICILNYLWVHKY